MKVNSIDKTQFYGRFRNNVFMEKVLASAEPYDLEVFLALLNRMEKVGDGKEYSLGLFSNPLAGGDFLDLFENGQRIGVRHLQLWDKKTGGIWFSVLKNINILLSNRYPAPARTSLPKEQLLKDIYNKFAK